MQFINPVFLWGLLLLAIPIIIHLFRFRRFKKVYFSNTPFLQEIKETSQQSRKIKHLLVLLMRLLAVAFLVLAFAQPIIHTDDKVVTGNRAVSVFVDNSFSMSSMGRDINLLDYARITARDIIESYGESDEFQILTGDFENRHQRLYNRDQALNLLDEIEPSPAVRTLSEVLQRQKHALRNYPSERKNFYQISDFQKNITDLDGTVDTVENLYLVHLESVESRNISVDSVWFSQPVQIINQTGELLVKLTNHDQNNAEEVNVELRFGDQRRPAGRASLEPGETMIDTVSFTINRTGWQKATVSISDYPIQFDDDYHIAFHVRHNIRVLTLHRGDQSNRFLSALFRGVPYLTEDQMRETNINYGVFSDYSLIILNELTNISSGLASELDGYLAAGGNVLIFPGAETGGEVLKPLSQRLGMVNPVSWEEGEFRVAELNLEDPIFAGVFEEIREDLSLPKATGRYHLSRSGANPGLSLMDYRDGRPYVAKYRHGPGSVFVSSAPLSEEWNDLVSNGEIFVPLLYRSAIAAGQLDKPAYVLGQDQLIPVRNVSADRQSEFRITGEREFVPGVERTGRNLYLNVYDQVREPGFYEIRQGDELHKLAAFNFDRRESEIAAWSEEELKDIVGDQAEVISRGTGAADGTLFSSAKIGNELWQWCIAIVLIALLLEQLILRFWKVGNRKKGQAAV